MEFGFISPIGLLPMVAFPDALIGMQIVPAMILPMPPLVLDLLDRLARQQRELRTLRALAGESGSA